MKMQMLMLLILFVCISQPLQAMKRMCTLLDCHWYILDHVECLGIDLRPYDVMEEYDTKSFPIGTSMNFKCSRGFTTVSLVIPSIIWPEKLTLLKNVFPFECIQKHDSNQWSAKCTMNSGGYPVWESKSSDDVNGCCPTNWYFNHKRLQKYGAGGSNLDIIITLPPGKWVLT